MAVSKRRCSACCSPTLASSHAADDASVGRRRRRSAARACRRAARCRRPASRSAAPSGPMRRGLLSVLSEGCGSTSASGARPYPRSRLRRQTLEAREAATRAVWPASPQSKQPARAGRVRREGSRQLTTDPSAPGVPGTVPALVHGDRAVKLFAVGVEAHRAGDRRDRVDGAQLGARASFFDVAVGTQRVREHVAGIVGIVRGPHRVRLVGGAELRQELRSGGNSRGSAELMVLYSLVTSAGALATLLVLPVLVAITGISDNPAAFICAISGSN